VVTDLSAFTRLVSLDHGLCVLSTARGGGAIHSCVINAGVLRHPLSGDDVVGLVSAGGTTKLRNLRADPRATIVVRAGWEWAGVEGTADLIGPDDPRDGIESDALRVLLRDVFRAAGGSHDDWDTYDSVMADERRAAVLITPRRVYGNTRSG
jgi:PPOX class probable F420-dependent enzyme